MRFFFYCSPFPVVIAVVVCAQHLVSVVEKDYGIPPWASLGGAFTLSLVLPFLLVFFIAGPEQPTSAPAPSSNAHAPPTAKETPAQAKKGTPSKPSKENKKTN